MYFKRLELVGFKSFMDKTVLHFEPGVTAVVGPNGCGKSNIFDAIRWVLGEQSVKSLRGADMQDVIFNGTDSQAPLGMAEVSLAFANEERVFNVDHNEVVITRRLFRSGESEYLLNRQQVRLKDIMDLLLGTGIGAESYSIVAQGKIDLILSSKPEERRMVFDEASGITKYKSQKRETMRRLEETEQNLLRINDIISEVQRSIGHLERQANKARRYKELYEELKGKDIKLSLLQRNELLKLKNDISAQLDELKAKEQSIQESIVQEEQSIENNKLELKAREESIALIKQQANDLENLISRNNQHIGFNQERIKELDNRKVYLADQITQTKSRIILDEDKISRLKQEQSLIKSGIEEKTQSLSVAQEELNILVASIKDSLDSIAESKRKIMDLASQIAQAKNAVVDLNSKQQVHLARNKRLDLEKAKVDSERLEIENNLSSLGIEMQQVEAELNNLNLSLDGLKVEMEKENLSLGQITEQLDKLEKERLTLQSHKEFLGELKTQYEGIDTAMNAVIYLDQPMPEKMGGMVVKIKDYLELDHIDKVNMPTSSLKISAEAKPIDLDAQKVTEKIALIEQEIQVLNTSKSEKEKRISMIAECIANSVQKQQDEEVRLANKKTIQESVLGQLAKIKEEEEVIDLELNDVRAEISDLDKKIALAQEGFAALDIEHKAIEAFIHEQQEKITTGSYKKEGLSVLIAQFRAELEAMGKKLASDESTLKMLEETFLQDQQGLKSLEAQAADLSVKQQAFGEEIKDLENKIIEIKKDIEVQLNSLKEAEAEFIKLSDGLSVILEKIEEKKKELDSFKDKVYELQMQDKDLDFKVISIKDRVAQAYKVDLDSLEQEAGELDAALLSQEIDKLREKVENYGNVNLVAIEEYDELKKRYDFLTQQQGDLVTAKSSLQEAIQKINRTTKKMFVETFDKVKEEFRNYFKLLFNGGDAQLFLIDESDPLESGIEIICRPPGKKLQNVLLLSGGEKSMAAIALIFAIFKVKPAPFCILDEIDAALDEANVVRFSTLFQEFTGTSQFIVITHNKRTIANANVMYGITMQKSGISQIVSVKFAENKPQLKNDDEPQKEAVAA